MPPLVPAALAFGAGVALAPIVPLGAPWLILASALAALVAWRGRALSGFLAVLVLWTGLGILRSRIASFLPAHHLARFAPSDSVVALHGVVVDDPVELFSPREAARQACVIEVDRVRVAGRWRRINGRVRARIDADHATAYGDELLLEGLLGPVPPPTNPGQFDWRASLARQGVSHLMMARPQDPIVRLAARRGQPIVQAMLALRHRWEALLDAYFDSRHAGLLRSLILGERVALDESTKRAFVETGTIHLLVISGFNVGLIVWLCELALRWLGWPQRLRLAACAVLVSGYGLLVGLQAPVLRSMVMAWIVLAGLWMDRTVNWPNALAASALLILAWRPSQLMDPGFQLSFGAVAGLLALTARVQSVLLRDPTQVRVLVRYLAMSIASTSAVWIGLWPVLAWYFHLIAPVSVLANLLLVPLVSVTVGVGTIVLAAGTVAEDVVGWMALPMRGLVDLIIGCVHACHRLPWGAVAVGHPSWTVVLGYYGWLVASVLRRRLGLTSVAIAAGWLIAANILVWTAVAHAWLWRPPVEVIVLDVGHGDGIVVRTPAGQTMLVDAGTEEAGEFAVLPFLRYRGWRTLEALILTHPDDDHVGGALPVLRELRVKRLLTNGTIAASSTGRRVLDAAQAAGLREERLAAGMQLRGLDGVSVDVLHPPPRFVPNAALRANDNSLVLRLTVGQSSLLLTGDLEQDGWPYVLASGQRLDATVLKVPHHGSALGEAGQAMLAAVHPRLAIISVGRLHHLPSAMTLEQLSRSDAQVLMTRDEGAITLRMDGDRVSAVTFRDGQERTVR